MSHDDLSRERGEAATSVKETERAEEIDDLVRRRLRERGRLGIPAQELLVDREDQIGARSLEQ